MQCTVCNVHDPFANSMFYVVWEILPYQEPSDVTVHLYSVHEPFCQFNFSCSLENDSNPSIPIALWHHCTIVQCAMHTVHGPYRLFNFSSFLANDAKWEILPYQEPPVVTVHLCMNPFAYSICHLFCGKSSHTKSLLSSLNPFIYSTGHLFWQMTQSVQKVALSSLWGQVGLFLLYDFLQQQ